MHVVLLHSNGACRLINFYKKKIKREVQHHRKVFDQTKLKSAASHWSRIKHASAGVKLISVVGLLIGTT